MVDNFHTKIQGFLENPTFYFTFSKQKAPADDILFDWRLIYSALVVFLARGSFILS